MKVRTGTARSVLCDRAGLVLVTTAFFNVFVRAQADPDLWGHLTFGLDFLQTWRVDRPDPYSYLSSGQRWINHEWLAEAILAGVFTRAGATGLILFKLLATGLIGWVLFRRLRRQGLGVAPAGTVLMLASPLLYVGLVTIRPQLFTYVLFVVLLLLLDRADRGGVRWLWLTPPLFAVWVNLHGGFVAGIGVLGLWLLGDAAGKMVRRVDGAWAHPRIRAVTLLPVVCAILATALNPYGVDLWAFLFRTLGPRPDIAEWGAVVPDSALGRYYVLLVVVLVVAVTASRRPRSVGMLTVLAGTLLLPLIAMRHVVFFGIAAVFVTAEHLADAFGRSRLARRSPVEPAAWVAPMLLAYSLVLAAWSIPSLRCITVEDDMYPVGAVALLEATGATGNMAVLFGWGEYVIWHLAPDVKVSVDGRRETVYSDEIQTQDVRSRYGIGDWSALVRDERTTLALVSKRFPTFNLMSLYPGWELVYDDEISGLFVRDGSPMLQPLRQAAAEAVTPEQARARCFPDG